MRGISKRRVGAVAAALLAIGGGLFVSGETSAAGKKTYTVTPTTATYAKVVQQSIVVTLTNTAAQPNTFGSANIPLPGGIAAYLVGTPNASNLSGTGKTAASTLAVNAGVIELRQLNVVKGGGYVTVSLPATIPCNTVGNTYTWTDIDVRQSNDFSGAGNDFTPAGPAATFTIADGGCADITCLAGDSGPCTTGDITSSDGLTTANIVVNDGDGLDANLTAAFVSSPPNCSATGTYAATSSPLQFDLQTTGDITNMTKTVTFSQPVQTGKLEPSDYQVCFEADYDFAALDMNELLEDFTNYDFTGNTTQVGSFYSGYLVPCDYGLTPNGPCVESRAISSGRIIIVLTVPAGDPRTYY